MDAAPAVRRRRSAGAELATGAHGRCRRLSSEPPYSGPTLGLVDVTKRTGVLLCVLAVSLPAGAVGCGSTRAGGAESGAEAAEHTEEEAQKKEEAAEVAKNRELLSQIEAKKREEDAELKAHK